MYNMQFLLSDEAAAQRAERSNTGFVVHVECARNRYSEARFEELDADSEEHARVLAEDWINREAAISAAVRRKDASGKLSKALCIVSNIYN
jgi:hypothetical protein